MYCTLQQTKLITMQFMCVTLGISKFQNLCYSMALLYAIRINYCMNLLQTNICTSCSSRSIILLRNIIMQLEIHDRKQFNDMIPLRKIFLRHLHIHNLLRKYIQFIFSAYGFRPRADKTLNNSNL